MYVYMLIYRERERREEKKCLLTKQSYERGSQTKKFYPLAYFLFLVKKKKGEEETLIG